MSGDKIGGSMTKFTDVKAIDWFAPFVAWAFEHGIVSGTSDTTFSPDEKITRQDMMVMVVRFMEYKKFTPELTSEKALFADNSDIADYAKQQVYELKQAGLVSGRGANKFEPKASATRAEAAQMMANIHKAMEAVKASN